MNLSVDVVLPHKVKSVEMLSEEKQKEWEDDYDVGFSAGYQQGQWRASLELELIARQQAIEIQSLINSLKIVHNGLEELVQQHLPELLRTALERVFSKYQLTDEQMVHEIEALVKEMKQGDSVKIELSPSQLERVYTGLNRYGISLPNVAMSWEPNSTLQEGEFMLTSELGQFDGRTSKRITKIQEALEPFVNL